MASRRLVVDGAGADNKTIRRTILREALAVRLGRRSAAAVSPPA